MELMAGASKERVRQCAVTPWPRSLEGVTLALTQAWTLGRRASTGAVTFGRGLSHRRRKLALSFGVTCGERNVGQPLRGGTNLILLDEPTHGLDVNSIRALEAGLAKSKAVAVIFHAGQLRHRKPPASPSRQSTRVAISSVG